MTVNISLIHYNKRKKNLNFLAFSPSKLNPNLMQIFRQTVHFLKSSSFKEKQIKLSDVTWWIQKISDFLSKPPLASFSFKTSFVQCSCTTALSWHSTHHHLVAVDVMNLTALVRFTLKSDRNYQKQIHYYELCQLDCFQFCL